MSIPSKTGIHLHSTAETNLINTNSNTLENKMVISDLARKERKQKNKHKHTSSPHHRFSCGQWHRLLTDHLALPTPFKVQENGDCPLNDDQLRFLRSHVSVIFGTQEPTLTLRTGFTSLVTTATPNLVQVVAMDVTGFAAWSSFANIFDEYRVKRAKLHIIPSYSIWSIRYHNCCYAYYSCC